MHVDPRQLSLFLEVVRAGSFTGAAEKRNMTQPAVSMAIAQLERALDARLLDRTRTGVTLTPAGVLVLRRAEAIESHIAAAATEVKASQSGISGPLIVGGTPGALLSLLPSALRHMAAEFPNLALHIREGADAELLELLRSGKVDVAVGTTRVDAMPPDIAEIDVCSDSFVIVSRPGRRKIGHPVALHELVDESWVLPAEGGAFRRQVDALFLAGDFPMPRNVVRCDSLATTKEIVRTNDYISLLPQRVVATEVRHGLLETIALREQPLRRWIGLRVLKQAMSSPLTAAFASALAAQDEA